MVEDARWGWKLNISHLTNVDFASKWLRTPVRDGNHDRDPEMQQFQSEWLRTPVGDGNNRRM